MQQHHLADGDHVLDQHLALQGAVDHEVQIPAGLLGAAVIVQPVDRVLTGDANGASGRGEGRVGLQVQGLLLQVAARQSGCAARGFALGLLVPDAVERLGAAGIGPGVGVLEVLAGAEDHDVALACRMANQRGRGGDRLRRAGGVDRRIERLATERHPEARGHRRAVVGSAERIVLVDLAGDQVEAPEVALQVAGVGVVGYAVAVVVCQARAG